METADKIRTVRITIYEPAFGIIGDPAKRDPRTRQSADHSMVYIIATLLRKAIETRANSWEALMLMPEDYSDAALFHPLTRRLMERIDFRHGGPEYDAKYPDGIPTTVEIEHEEVGHLTSGLVMYPEGHARCTSGNLDRLLDQKFRRLASLAVDDVEALRSRFSDVGHKSAGGNCRSVRHYYQGMRMTCCGVVNLHKPTGITSRGAVDAVKRLVRPAKCGHAGTLDPLASGVLVVCVGKATRLIEYVQQMPKQYRGTFLLGRTSPTEDLEGEVTELVDAPVPSRLAIAEACARFVGTIEQRPPVFSALKIKGRPAYALRERDEPLSWRRGR